MIVVKLGGSLYNSPHLPHWLKLISDLSTKHTIVIVPGGGPFADNVRKAQQCYKFDDSIAHHMAILAMAQFGLLLKGVLPESHSLYFPHNTIMPNPNSVSIWLPDASLLHQTELNHSWEVSSDSLALWLAQKLQAQQLILVKSCQVPNTYSLASLTKAGIIDDAFEQLYLESPITTQLINAAHSEQLADLVIKASD